MPLPALLPSATAANLLIVCPEAFVDHSCTAVAELRSDATVDPEPGRTMSNPEEPKMLDRKQINFTIVPDDSEELPRTYANFCAISHTPFDFTLAFCEVLPLSEKDIKEAEADHTVKAPVRAKIVVPLQVVPNLIAALQEHMRVFSESTGGSWDKGPVH